MSDQPLKRAVITEELVAITDSVKEAIVLRQLLYWLPRTRYVDQYIEEERERNTDTTIQPTNGWVYKSGKEMADETMIGTAQTARRCLKSLVEKEYVNERENPDSPWDKTLQYRLNVRQIEADLQAAGYTLKTVVGRDWPVYKSALSGDASKNQNDDSSGQSGSSSGQNGRSYTENTTETTTESTPARETPAPQHPEPDRSEETSTPNASGANGEKEPPQTPHRNETGAASPTSVPQAWKSVTGEEIDHATANALRDAFGRPDAPPYRSSVFKDVVLEAYLNVGGTAKRIRVGYLMTSYRKALNRKSSSDTASASVSGWN